MAMTDRWADKQQQKSYCCIGNEIFLSERSKRILVTEVLMLKMLL